MPKIQIDKRLVVAVVAFVVFDLGTLAFNFQIARHVENDAIAINLAGRQRMLSQRITKAALLAVNPRLSDAKRAEFSKEAVQAYTLFRSTLSAFAEGGEAIGGDGRKVVLQAVGGKAALMVGDVRGTLDHWPSPPGSPDEFERFSEFMVEQNSNILSTMNNLTTELERESVASISVLRIAQSLAFALSLGNFFFILFEMRRAQRRAETEAVTDPLTGLLNRAGLYQTLTDAVDQNSIEAEGLGVILLDLDNFKAVNDTYGHAAGDETLLETAHRIRSWLSPRWVCGRLGGDEFAIVCPGASAEKTKDAATALSKLLQALPGGEMLISASVGYASADTESTPDSLLAVADTAMYEAKSLAHKSHAHVRRRR